MAQPATKAAAIAALLEKGIVPRVLSSVEAAAYVGLSRRSFQRICARGDGPIPARLSCRRKVWTVGTLDAWLERRKPAAVPTLSVDPIMDAIKRHAAQ